MRKQEFQNKIKKEKSSKYFFDELEVYEYNEDELESKYYYKSKQKVMYLSTNIITNDIKSIDDVQIYSFQQSQLISILHDFEQRLSTQRFQMKIIDPKSISKLNKQNILTNSFFSQDQINQYGMKCVQLLLKKKQYTNDHICNFKNQEKILIDQLLKRQIYDHKQYCLPKTQNQSLFNYSFVGKRFQKKVVKKQKEQALMLEKYKNIWKSYNIEKYTILQIKKKFRLSFYKINKIIKQKSIQEINSLIYKTNKLRFPKIHQKARKEINHQLLFTSRLIQLSDIQKLLKEKLQLLVSKYTISQYLKNILHLRYKTIKPITQNHNLVIRKIERQISAANYIDLLLQGKTIINIDETVLNTTDSRKKGWINYGKKNMVCHSQRLHQVNMIAAVSNKGELYFTINNSRTNSNSFTYFICKLVDYLNEKIQCGGMITYL